MRTFGGFPHTFPDKIKKKGRAKSHPFYDCINGIGLHWIANSRTHNNGLIVILVAKNGTCRLDSSFDGRYEKYVSSYPSSSEGPPFLG